MYLSKDAFIFRKNLTGRFLMNNNGMDKLYHLTRLSLFTNPTQKNDTFNNCDFFEIEIDRTFLVRYVGRIYHIYVKPSRPSVTIYQFRL